MPIDITNKEEKKIALTGTQIEEALLQAHLSKDAIEKIEGLETSASEIDNMSCINQDTIVLDGDSIMRQGLLGTSGRGAFSWGNALLGQRFNLIANYGVSGDRTDQILARLDTTLAANSRYVHYIMGKNDVIQARAYADIIENMSEIFTKTIKSGKIIIASTIIPAENDTTTIMKLINKLNRWIKEQRSILKDYIVVDYHKVTVNPSTGLCKTGYTMDNTHPSDGCAYVMGKEFKKTIDQFLPIISRFTNSNIVDDVQIVANSLMIGGTTTSTGWTSYGDTFAKAIDSDGIEYQKITGTVLSPRIMNASIYTGFTAGDIISGFVELEIESGTDLDEIYIDVYARNSTAIIGTYNGFYVESTTKVFPVETFKIVVKIPPFEVPADTVRIVPNISIGMIGTSKLYKFQLFNHGQ